MIHHRVVDSSIMATNAVGIPALRWGLAKLCSQLCGIDIREGDRGIHDCLEDVHATREVVLFCTQSKEEFQCWGKETKILQLRLRLQEERDTAQALKKNIHAAKSLLNNEGGKRSIITGITEDKEDSSRSCNDVESGLST